MQPPVFLQIAAERVATFRREVEILRENGRLPASEPGDFVRARADGLLDADQLVGESLLWAHATPVQPAASLEEVREALDRVLADWFGTWSELGRLGTIDPRSRLQETVRSVLSRQRPSAIALAEGWPASKRDDEKRLLTEMKHGRFLELDDAFASIAGVSADEWRNRARR